MSPSAAVGHTDVFLIVFGQQWRFAAQRNKTYQASVTQIKTDCRWFWFSVLVLIFPWDLLTVRKKKKTSPHIKRCLFFPLLSTAYQDEIIVEASQKTIKTEI